MSEYTPTMEDLIESYAMSEDGLDFKRAAQERGEAARRLINSQEAEYAALLDKYVGPGWDSASLKTALAEHDDAIRADALAAPAVQGVTANREALIEMFRQARLAKSPNGYPLLNQTEAADALLASGLFSVTPDLDWWIAQHDGEFVATIRHEQAKRDAEIARHAVEGHSLHGSPEFRNGIAAICANAILAYFGLKKDADRG